MIDVDRIKNERKEKGDTVTTHRVDAELTVAQEAGDIYSCLVREAQTR